MSSTLSPESPAAKLAVEPYVFDGPCGCPVGPTGPTGPTGPKGVVGPEGFPSVALVCMTKDGVEKLPRLLETTVGFADKAVFLDTSNGVETKTYLEEKAPYPTIIYREPFVNFEVSRTRLNEIATGTADWLLLLDDDMALTFTVDKLDIKRLLRAAPDFVNGYMLCHSGKMSYWNTRLVRGNATWPYIGVTHEYIKVVPPPGKLEGVLVEHYFKHGPNKFQRDLQLLSADIARDPDNTRTIFYLANTLRDIGRKDAAIRFYIMRSSMGGWDEEVWVAMYEAARLAQNPEWMIRAYNYRPSRAESAHWLATYYASCEAMGQYLQWEKIRAATPVPQDVLFVNLACYGPNAN